MLFWLEGADPGIDPMLVSGRAPVSSIFMIVIMISMVIVIVKTHTVVILMIKCSSCCLQ